jgi:hypothetical protein
LTAAPELVPAVGGTRLVQAPDAIATEYLLLGLRLDQHIPGFVDAYFGPADLKAQVDVEQRRAPARLRDDVAALADRVIREVDASDRRTWLTDQLAAFDAHAAALAGEGLPYLDHVERCLGFAPPWHDESRFDAAAAEIDALLPGPGSVADRLEAWDRALEVPVERLPGVVERLMARFRERAGRELALPDGESVRIGLVSDQPWTAYCWYDGGRRSRFDVNTDLPLAAPALVHVVAHESYPGHHLEHAWKETDLVDRLGRLEASLLLINTPECPISEGLADYAERIVAPADERVELLSAVFDWAGLPLATDPLAAREVAERSIALAAPRRVLAAIRGNAAIRRHAKGASPDDVLAYLRDVGRYPQRVAAKRLEFNEHPLWRSYVFVYAEGEALVTRWVERAEAPDRVGRFGRLLREQLTPGRLLAELS